MILVTELKLKYIYILSLFIINIVIKISNTIIKLK